MRTLLAVCVCLLVLTTPARAELTEDFGASDIAGAVPGEALSAVEGITPDNAAENFDKGLLNLLSQASRLFSGSLGEGIRTALTVTVIAALCAAAGSVIEGIPVQYVQMAGVLGIAALTVGSLQGLTAVGREALVQMDTYSKALLPSLAAAAAASGKPAAAVLRHAGTVIAADLLITLYDRLLCPLLYVYAALITFNAALPRDMVKRIAGFVKWTVTGLLTLTLTIFTAYITIGGAISAQADAVSIKAAKTALSGVIPVVGSIIADASETVLSGAAVIKNAVGVFGLLVILGIILAPCVTLAVRYAAMKLGAALVGTVGGEALAGYTDSLAGLYSMLLAMVSASAFLLMISIVSCILTGGA